MFNQVLNYSNYSYNPHAVPVILAGILIFSIGIFIFLQMKRTLRNVGFVLFCMALSLWLIPSGVVYLANDPEVVLWWYKRFVFLGVVNIMPSFYLFSVATAGVLSNHRFGVIAGFVSMNLFYLFSLMTNLVITSPTQFYWGYYPHYEPTTLFFFIVYGVLFITSEILLWKAYKREPLGVKKSHILTIFVGLLVGFFASFDFVAKLWGVPLYPFGFIPSFILSAMVTYTVIRHRAFDIETVIHKTFLWVLSFSLITAPILIVYRILRSFIQGSDILQLIFWIISFIVFTFYLRVVQPKVDHLFQRRRANIEDILSQFVSDLVHLEGLEGLISRLEETILNVLYPQRVDIFVFRDKEKLYRQMNRECSRCLSGDDVFLKWVKDNNHIVYREFIEIDPEYSEIKRLALKYFDATDSWVVIPLILNEQLLGVINLTKKENLKRYNAVDFHFLTTLRNQSAIAISNSLIYQDIEEQVKQRTKELMEVQKQLVQAEKLATVGTLSGGVAHEINNPLTAILTNVQMLLAFAEGDEVQADRESLELIEEATQRCRIIVQKLMTYSKKPTVVVKKTISFVKYQLEQDNIELVLNLDDGPFQIKANQNEMEQVLTNLILNAKDAITESKKTGVVTVILSNHENQVTLEVQDDGVGMAEETASKIFDPFFTTKDVGKGLGLGLSICHSIVEKFGGEIKVNSVQGQGTSFSLCFFYCDK